jgi:HEAT repeats
MPDLTPDQLRERLEQLLLAEDAWGHARAQVAALGPAAAPVLIELIQGRAHDTKFTERAILALGVLGGPEDTLTSLLADPDPMIKIAALSALREIGEARTAPAVHDLLADDVPAVRKEAVKTIAALGTAESVEPLRTVAEGDPEPFLREQALGALRQVEERRSG